MFLNVGFQISRVTTCDKTFSNLCNRLHNICNRLPMFLNVLMFKFKHEESHLLMCNRLHYDGNRLPVTYFEN